MTFTGRLVLQPNQIVRYRVSFDPEATGFYSHSYPIEIIGVNLGYFVKCEALCEIPRIDFEPETVFCKVVNKTQDRLAYDNFVYVKGDNTFYFGPILTGSSR